MFRSFMHAIFVALALVAMPVTNVSAAPVAYASTNAGNFGMLDMETGVFTRIGNFGRTLTGLVNLDDTIYGASYRGSSIYTIDTSNGGLTLLGSPGFTVFVFGGTNSALYALDLSMNLHSIDPITGASSLIGATGVPGRLGTSVISLSSDALELYLISDVNLYILDTLTGAGTLIGSTGGPRIGAMAEIDGQLYGGVNNQMGFQMGISTLDTTTGHATITSNVSGTSDRFFYGMTSVFSNPPLTVPEPGSCMLLAVGFLGIWLQQRKKLLD